MKVSLTNRLVIVVVIIQSLILAIVLTYLFAVNPPALIHQVMQKQLKGLSDNVHRSEDGTPALTINHSEESRGWIYTTLPNDILYQIVDASGNVVFSPSYPQAFSNTGHLAPVGTDSFYFSIEERRLYVERRSLTDEFSSYRLQVATSERLFDLFELARIGPLSRFALLLIITSMLGFAGATIFTVRKMMKPLVKVSEAATRIAPHNLTQRLPETLVPVEIEGLIHAFNAALERLEKGFDIQQDMLATTAHELKTPLTLIRSELEAFGSSPTQQLMLNDVDTISRQVNQILHLSEARGMQNYAFTTVDLVDLADEVTRYLVRVARKRNMTLLLDFSEQIKPQRADRGMLFILLKNLVENAITHGREHSAVRIQLADDSVVVQNEGETIPSEHIAKLFDKFWRASHQRGLGAGLGLSICQEIADKHGWYLGVTSVHHITRFTVAFSV